MTEEARSQVLPPQWPSRFFGPGVLLLGAFLLPIGVLAPEVLRVLVVLPLALVLPGAATTYAIRPPRSDVRSAEFLGLRLVLSLAFYPLLALVLFALTVRYSTESFVVATDVFVVAMVVVGWYSRRSISAPESAGTWNPGGEGARWAIWLACVVALCATAIVATNALVPRDPTAQFSSIFLLKPPVGSVLEVSRGKVLDAPIGVANSTDGPENYHLTSRIDAAEFGRDLFIMLEPGRQWSGVVSGTVPDDGCSHHVVVVLTDSAELARSVGFWARVAGTNGCRK